MSQNSKTKRPASIWMFSIIALIFGGLTIRSSGLVLFTTGEFHQQQGDFVPFVVWTNFICGFAYVITATGLFLMKPWATYLACLITLVTVTAYIFFGMHVINGGLYEMQTIVAMAIRTLFWTGISWLAYYHIMRPRIKPAS